MNNDLQQQDLEIIPIVFEILAATVEMCSFQLKYSSIITPQNLMLDLRSIKLFFVFFILILFRLGGGGGAFDATLI